MALVRKVKCPGLTFFHIAEELFKAAMSCFYNSARVDIVFDAYLEQSIKILKEIGDSPVPYHSKKLLEVM